MIYKLIDFLRENSVEELQNRYSIQVKQHSKYPNLHLFKYNQIESDMSEPIVQLCRGVILDKDQFWLPVCFPYTKFFNAGEEKAADIDWKSARFYEKLDGSLCQLYYYDGKWNVATSGLPDAAGKVNAGFLTFEELFWKVWAELKYELPKITDYCYLFELMTPLNRVVVNHVENRIVLHGVRSLMTFKEHNPERFAADNKWECVKTYSFQNVDEILNSLAGIDPLKQEGYIVRDANFNRVKMKAPQYVALHHAIDGMTTRKLIEIVQLGELSEAITYFPALVEVHNDVAKRFSDLCNSAQEEYEKHKHIENKKEFALKVKDHRLSGALFAIHNKKFNTFQGYFSKITVEKLEELLGLKSC